MNQTLLDETIDLVSAIIRFPGGFTNHPESASVLVETLIPIVLAMQTGNPLKECIQLLNSEVDMLTKDVPKARSQGARLCDDMLSPEYKSSFGTLKFRSNEICSRLIKGWKPVRIR
jgi:hypothetical protein